MLVSYARLRSRYATYCHDHERKMNTRPLISPGDLEDSFLAATAENTGKGIESCALLCGIISDEVTRLTHLVLPRQRGTENTVEMLEDVDVDLCVMSEGLSILGWIHTHPTQTAFLSSVDIHTQFGYQRLLPEAVAVVCAPQFGCNKWLRLTEQGMKITADCPFRGFHQHVSKAKLFGPALNITFDSSRVQIFDFRTVNSVAPGTTTPDNRAGASQVERADAMALAGTALQPTAHHGEHTGTAVHQPSPEPKQPAAQGMSPGGVQSPPPQDQAPARARGPLSKLRRTAVKLEKNRSHQVFLETCKDKGYIPRGFRLKWKCHFDESDSNIQEILNEASLKLVSACVILAGEKIQRLEQEYSHLLGLVKSTTDQDGGKTIDAIIASDTEKTRASNRKVKNKKLQRIQPRQSMESGTSEPKPIPIEVVNMSKRTLSSSELSLLTRGLSFAPSRKQTVAQLTADLKEWERLMRLREYWYDNRNAAHPAAGAPDDDSKYKQSRWVPPRGREPWLDMYLDEVTASVLRETKTRGTGNLSKDEEAALLSLIQDDSIVIRPADKGSSIVIMNTEDYLAKLDEEVGDTTTYQPVSSDQTSQVHKRVRRIVDDLARNGHIGPHQKAYLLPARPQPGHLQGNPKLHKPGAPLRAIISGRGHATERIAEMAEEQLRAHVEHQPSYVRDTSDFISKLRETAQPIVAQVGHTPLLFCMDVKKLYPSVPRADGIEACRVALDGRTDASIPTASVIEMIETVLDSNNFNLTPDRQFVQTDGTAIGSRLGKNYACTYLGRWEQQLLEEASLKPVLYLRYIDDIFGVWLHGQEELIKFCDSANQIHSKIQVDLRSSESEIEFLDVLVGPGQRFWERCGSEG